MIEEQDLENALEAVLFVSTDAVTIAELSKIFEYDKKDIENALIALQNKIEVEKRGVVLKQIAGGWRMFSNPKFHEVIKNYILSIDPRKLSTAALETLAIIAYSQPVTRAGVASVRGVSSDSSINSLIEKGLVKEAGVADSAGSPTLYATTSKFLENFGLNSIKDLPALENFAPDEKTKQFISQKLNATTSDMQPEQLNAFSDNEKLNETSDNNSDINHNKNLDQNDSKDFQSGSQKLDEDSEDKIQDAKSVFEAALAGALGATEKVDLDKLEILKEDE